MGSLILMHEDMGDLTISWEEDKDKEMEQLIQKKMDQGVRFFIIAPFSKEQIEVTKVSDITARELRIPDADIEKLFTEGKVGIVKRITTAITSTVKLAKTAAEASKNNTVGVKQFKGG